ncbi:nucleoside triphosphate pyrophosphohydrolase [Candidatus Calescamantes bacterium]|nr:nucleoside triphosphate pyrophosphohydrolase [Candidatus Calescamantes bacterium]
MKQEKFEKLVWIMEKLRSDEGCPWDRKQTNETLLPYLIEETYELVDSIEKNDREEIKEELGDLLLQVIFQAQIAKEKGWFDIYEVIENLCEKLIRRHPHVFGEKRIKSAEEVLKHWEKIKSEEGKDNSLLSGVPRSMPPLTRAYYIQKKAEKVGFDWKNWEDVLKKIVEEIEELKESISKREKEKITEEIGDLLFSIVNLARFLNIFPDLALRKTIEKFEVRFKYMEEKAKAQGKTLEEMSLEEMDKIWEEGKERL